MADKTSSAAFAGDGNQGFQLGNNPGRRRCQLSYRAAWYVLLYAVTEIVLTSVCSCQRKRPDLALTPPCRFGETMTLSIATHLLEVEVRYRVFAPGRTLH